MNRKNIWKRIVSECLVLAMVFTTIFAQPGLMAKAAGENEMSIAYEKVDGGLFYFQGTLASGKTLQSAGYDWSTATGTVQVGTAQTDGTLSWTNYTVNNNLSFVTDGNNQIIWYDGAVVNYDALKIVAGTVFTFSGKTSAKITNTLYLVKNSSEVWEDRSDEYFDGNEMSIAYEKVADGFFHFQGTLSTGKTLQSAGYDWSTATGTIQAATKEEDGTLTWSDYVVNNNMSFVTDGNNQIIWYDGDVINKDAIKIDEGTVFTFAGKTAVRINSTLYLVKNESGEWVNTPVELGLTFNESTDAWYFTSDITPNSEYYRVEMEVDGTKYTVPIQNTKDGKFVIYSSFFTDIASISAPTSTLKIAKGATLVPSSDAWADSTTGTRYVLKDAIDLECKNGVWGVKAAELPALELTFDKVTDAWYFKSDIKPESSFYRVEMEVDGTKYTVPMSNGKDGTFVIWPNFFTDIGGASSAPTSTLKIAKGTELVPSSDAWDTTADIRYVLKEDIDLEYKDGEWGVKGAALPEMGLSFKEVTDAWYFTSDVTPESPYYRVEMEIDGVKHTVPIGNNNNGTFVIWENFFTAIGGASKAPQNTLKIAKGAVLTPSTDAWGDTTGTKYALKEEIDLEYKNGEWQVKGSGPVEIGLTYEQVTDVWYFASDLTPDSPYYRVEMEIDGAKYIVPIQNTKDGKFVIYANYFTEIAGVNAPGSTLKIAKGAEFVPSTDAWTDDEAGAKYILKEAIDLTYKYGAWGLSNRTTELSTVTLNAYSWGGGTDGVIGITIGNVAELQSTAWYSAITTATNSTWGKLRGAVLVNGMPKMVDIQVPGNGEVFIYYEATEITDTFVIQKGTEFIPIEGSANVGNYAIKFDKDYEVDVADKVLNLAPEAVYKTVVNLVSANGYEWHFDSTQKLSDITTAKFFIGTVVIDGKESKMVWDITDNQLVIWGEAYYTEAGGVAPTKSFTIPAGTIFYEIAPTETGWKTAVSGGTQLVVTNEFKVEKLGSSWISFDKKEDLTSKPNNVIFDKNGNITIPATEPYFVTRLENNETVSALNKPGTYDITSVIEKVTSTAGEATASALAGHENISLSYNKITTANEWYFAVKSGSLATATSDRFYKVPATIDGKATFVVITIPANSTELIIWSNFFAAVPGADSVAPTKELKIAAGAVMAPVSSSGWGETSGTPIQVQNDLTVNITKILQTTRTVVYVTGDVTLDMAIDSRDIVALKKIATMNANATLSHAGLAAGDVDNNGATDAVDVRLLRQKMLETVTAGKVLTKGKTYAIANGAMPIIGYDGPDYNADRGAAGKQADFITDEIYAMVKEAGINTVVSNYNQIGTDYTTASKMLQLAEDNGLRVFLHDAYVSDKDNPEQVKTADAMKANIAKYSMYNSFAGYYLYDEPYKSTAPDEDSGRLTITDFETPLGLLKDSANVNGYMNLFPNISTQIYGELDNPNPSFWDQLFGNDTLGDGETVTEANYKSYLTQAVQSGMEFISYDYYLRGNDYKNDKYAFYQNMKWASDVADAQGVPFYAFIQVGTSFKDNNTGNVSQSNLTTVQEMYLEANAALAMGAKGLNYYSLIQPLAYAKNSNGSYDVYRSGLININGERNNGAGGANYEYFNAAKKINTFVAEVDEVLMHSVKKAAIATDSNVKSQVGGVASCGSVSSVSGNNALVGCFDYCGKEAYMVVNTSCDAGTTGSTQTITLNFYSAKGYTYTGMDCVEHTGNNKSLALSIPAGEAVLVVLD